VAEAKLRPDIGPALSHHVPVVSGLNVAQSQHGRYLAIFGRRSSAPISSVPRQAARTSSLEMADEDLVVSEVDADGVATVTLNRPQRRNAWTAAMEVRYFDVLREADADPAVRVAVLTGAGTSFCPGIDMARPPRWPGGG
jgi:hypothetical protein